MAECIIECQVPISFDLADDNPLTGRFVLIDNYDIAGGGIILEDLSDHLSDRKKKVKMRNYNWAKSEIVEKDRIEQYGQRSVLVLITGPRDCGKKMLARTLEKNLFENKRVVYFLGIGSVLYGVDSDIKGTKDESRQEHIRRMAEIANIMLDAGVILVVTAIDLTQDDYENICTSVDAQKIIMVWKGDEPPASMPVDLNILLSENEIAAADKIKDYIFKKGFIFTQQ